MRIRLPAGTQMIGSMGCDPNGNSEREHLTITKSMNVHEHLWAMHTILPVKPSLGPSVLL